MGDSCTTAASMYFTYSPTGVGWDCKAYAEPTYGLPGCDPDFTSAHDTTRPRLRIDPNHQQGELFSDTEPMYQQ